MMVERKGVPLKPDWKSFYERDDQLDQLVKSAVVIGRSALAGRHNEPLDSFVPPEWRGDREFTTVLRAASSPITSTSAAALSTISQQFLRALTPYSAAAALLAAGTVVRFDGAGSLTFPTLAAPLGLASFVAEGSPIPAWNLTSGAGPTLHPCILAGLTALTGEMLRSSQAETMVRQAILDAAAIVLDGALFGNDAEVVGTSPAGLLYGLTPITASTATPLSDAMISDVEALIAAVAPVAGNSPIAFIAKAPEAAALKLRTAGSFDYPIFTTSAGAAKTVIAVATQALVSASDPPRIDASQDTVVHMNTVPLPIGGATVASPSYSMFQTDTVSLRLRWPLSWVLRASNAVAVVNGVSW